MAQPSAISATLVRTPRIKTAMTLTLSRAAVENAHAVGPRLELVRRWASTGCGSLFLVVVLFLVRAASAFYDVTPRAGSWACLRNRADIRHLRSGFGGGGSSFSKTSTLASAVSTLGSAHLPPNDRTRTTAP